MITLSQTSPCILATTPLPSTLPSQADFANEYWNAQPTPLQAARNSPLTQTQCDAFLAQGLVVDYEIMQLGWDPFLVMLQRLTCGYVWFPNESMPPVTLVPGLQLAGFVTYNPTDPPNGAISVSLNPADYPPFNPPPAPLPVTDLVGLAYGPSVLYNYQGKSYPTYMSNPGSNNSAIADGGTYTDARGTFTKIVNSTPFGAEIFWILTSSAN